MKSIVLVTLVLQEPLSSYPEVSGYIGSSEWCYVFPPSGSTHVMLLHTDRSHDEIRRTIRGYLNRQDSFLIEDYDPTEATAHLISASESCHQWISARMYAQ